MLYTSGVICDPQRGRAGIYVFFCAFLALRVLGERHRESLHRACTMLVGVCGAAWLYVEMGGFSQHSSM